MHLRLHAKSRDRNNPRGWDSLSLHQGVDPDQSFSGDCDLTEVILIEVMGTPDLWDAGNIFEERFHLVFPANRHPSCVDIAS